MRAPTDCNECASRCRVKVEEIDGLECFDLVTICMNSYSKSFQAQEIFGHPEGDLGSGVTVGT